MVSSNTIAINGYVIDLLGSICDSGETCFRSYFLENGHEISLNISPYSAEQGGFFNKFYNLEIYSSSEYHQAIFSVEILDNNTARIVIKEDEVLFMEKIKERFQLFFP
jgi:hypothetical protein